MALSMSRIDRLYRTWRVKATLRDGSIADLNGVTVALVPPRAPVTAATTWATITYTPFVVPDADGYTGEATALIAGPDADPAGADLIAPTGGGHVWLRVSDTPEIDAQTIERIYVQ